MNRNSILRSMAQPIVAVLLVTASSLVTSQVRADNPSAKPVTALDLQPKANQKLSDSLHGFRGNDLAELPKGEQAFGGVKFKVEEGYIRLSGLVETSNKPKKPERIERIEVGKSFARLHILHGTGYGAFGTEGGGLFVKDGTLIGEYRLHYEDGATESIPIVYGEDVRDWWNWDKPADVTRGKIAWTGKNTFARQQNQNIHLYLATWTNPHPEKKVSSLDYICTGTTAASPFCIAISLEAK